jgi:hypothetical protein
MKKISKEQRRQVKILADNLILKDIPLPIIKTGAQIPEITKIIESHLIKLKNRNNLFLPNLAYHNETLNIFSDYGGDSKDSLYYTYSFLFSAYQPIGFFFNRMAEIRDKYGLTEPFVEIAFKKLNYGPMKRALTDYLTAANNLIPGLLLTIVIDKKVDSVIGSNDKNTLQEIQQILETEGLGSWKKKISEKILRILNIIGYFCALLSQEGQNLFWMTDNDEIVPNEEKSKAVLSLWEGVLQNYAPQKYKHIGATRPEIYEDSNHKNQLLDLLSITDLIAGSIEHYYTRNDKMELLEIKDDVNKILVWLSEQGISLKKLALIIRPGKNNGWETGIIKFEPKGDQKYFKFEPIYTVL